MHFKYLDTPLLLTAAICISMHAVYRLSSAFSQTSPPMRHPPCPPSPCRLAGRAHWDILGDMASVVVFSVRSNGCSGPAFGRRAERGTYGRCEDKAGELDGLLQLYAVSGTSATRGTRVGERHSVSVVVSGCVVVHAEDRSDAHPRQPRLARTCFWLTSWMLMSLSKTHGKSHLLELVCGREERIGLSRQSRAARRSASRPGSCWAATKRGQNGGCRFDASMTERANIDSEDVLAVLAHIFPCRMLSSGHKARMS
ncbi:hypothetical protein C8Q76DRAFT_714579 [Earliella scabrosa]|nr:hypothetical protein C8Q76DRAFT_714579 [Earliella scabrosa]